MLNALTYRNCHITPKLVHNTITPKMVQDHLGVMSVIYGVMTKLIIYECRQRNRFYSDQELEFGQDNMSKSVPCTGFASLVNHLVTVGEDSRICVIQEDRHRPIREFISSDLCSISCIIAAGESTVLTGNSRGLMNIWDVRSTDGKAVETFMLMDQEEVNATCIGRHPTQGHVIIVGHRDGSLSVWDLRKLDTPEAVLAGDDTAVNELHFNENYPNHLVTCTEGGDLWHWDVSAAGGRHTGVSFQEHEVTPWLQVSTENFSVQELLPNIILGINSLSIAGSRVICGTDDEAIYIVDNIKF
ncbi:nucleoporin Nup43-like [Artemia franciscana]|uniref:nucleoporin Nup43-like n=1 Tax=Artemia franciscana TaxID=6661 RepID=UPI0032DBC972